MSIFLVDEIRARGERKLITLGCVQLRSHKKIKQTYMTFVRSESK